ncbi:MAG: hypothetical protein WKF83_08725 [Nocardioidaceae bacterium]
MNDPDVAGWMRLTPRPPLLLGSRSRLAAASARLPTPDRHAMRKAYAEPSMMTKPTTPRG